MLTPCPPYTVSLKNLLKNDVKVYHLTYIVYLHYLVKLEMLIGHVLPLSCYRKTCKFTVLCWSPTIYIH